MNRQIISTSNFPLVPQHRDVHAYTNSKSSKKSSAVSDLEGDVSGSIPGLKYILNSKSNLFFKLIWFLILGGSFLICCYQICDRFLLFLSNPIDSRIELHRNQSVKFPSITVCPSKGNYPKLMWTIAEKAAELNTEKCNVTTENLVSDKLNISTIYYYMDTEPLINGPAIIAGKLSQYQEYAKSVQKQKTTTMLGTCVTFSIKELLPFRRDNVLFFLRTQRWNPSLMCNNNSVIHYSVHADDDDNTYKCLATFSEIPFDVNKLFGLEAKIFKVINRPDAPCDTPAVVSSCERKCLDVLARKKYIKCKLPFMRYYDLPLCKTGDEVREVYNIFSELAISITYSINCKCPRKCQEILYSLGLRTEGYYNPGVQLYFDLNVVDVIEEYYSYTVIPLLCDVGGNIGLFLGLCIPAILDLIQSIVIQLYKKIA